MLGLSVANVSAHHRLRVPNTTLQETLLFTPIFVYLSPIELPYHLFN